jgi:hypothetical protein
VFYFLLSPLSCSDFFRLAAKIGPRGFEPLTSCTPSYESTVVSGNLSQVTSSGSARCTARCTENGNEANADPLAGFVASLTPADRARLVALLTKQGEGGKGMTAEGALSPEGRDEA